MPNGDRVLQALLKVAGRRFGAEIEAHLERSSIDDRPRAANYRGIHSESA